MESAVTLDRLKNHFETIINRTFLAYDLRNCRDPADKETLRVIEQDVRYMEKAVADLKKVIADGNAELEEIHAQTRDIRALSESARHMVDNIPDSFPRGGGGAENRAPRAMEQVSSACPSSAHGLKENVAPAPAQTSTKVPFVPPIAPLTMDEFNDTPKYMLGRIPYASLNKTIQDINLTMAEKYRLLKKKQKDKTPQEVRLVQAFKKQENAESQGQFFILAEDVKLLGVSTEGFNSRQFATQLPILRHHRRLREIRGGGFTRLAIS